MFFHRSRFFPDSEILKGIFESPENSSKSKALRKFKQNMKGREDGFASSKIRTKAAACDHEGRCDDPQNECECFKSNLCCGRDCQCELDCALGRNDGLNKERLHPCCHKGPCEASTSACECFEQGQRCQRNCRCEVTCTRFSWSYCALSSSVLMDYYSGLIRWKGCKCNKSRNPCHPVVTDEMIRWSRCDCVRARRECDPEFCISCCARYISLHLSSLTRSNNTSF